MGLLLWRMDTERLWQYAGSASLPWLATALALYLVMILASAWRWGLLLAAQGVPTRVGALVSSFLVATFFNNFLPSNIGGDVVRIRDTAPMAGSRTLAATIVLIDRGIGLLGLVLVAAVGATLASEQGALPVLPSLLWAVLVAGFAASLTAVLAPGVIARLLAPLTAFHAEWVGQRIQRITGALVRFRETPGALAWCLAGAVFVQAVLVGFYVAIVYAMGIPIDAWHLAVLVPVSFIIQMVPVSVNGFGVREATFGFYFTRLGLPLESAVMVSLMGAGLMMVFSLSGAAAYVARRA